VADPRPVALKFARARRLRREQTDAELALWYRLRAQRLNGLRFRRQVPIGVFIADFCCRERHLVVELDGGQHAELTTAAKDRFRRKLIEERGYRVLRFWDNEVLTNIDGVIQSIIDAADRSVLNRDLTSP
jgi:very-short-patch-repair endonuclease